jgi:hypothetical protein
MTTTDLSSEPPRLASFNTQCGKTAEIDNSWGLLECQLDRDHDGPHWDRVDRIWWAQVPGA